MEEIPIQAWKEDEFVEEFGKVKCSVSSHLVLPPEKLKKKWTLSQLLEQQKKQMGNKYYANDLNLVKVCPQLGQKLSRVLEEKTPFLCSDGPSDLLRFLHLQEHEHEQEEDEVGGKPARYFNFYLYMGENGTSTPFHIDTLSTNAVNIVWEGNKRWWIVLCRDEKKVRDYYFSRFIR
jgi:hypothetical protein